MNLKLKLAFSCYVVNIIGMCIFGLIYVFNNEFMPFHADVIQTSWSELGKYQQILYLGMMRTEGAGFLATSLAMTILLLIPFRQKQAWSYWAITAIGLVEYLPTLIATFNVARITPALPPWLAVLLGCVTLLIALFLALRSDH